MIRFRPVDRRDRGEQGRNLGLKVCSTATDQQDLQTREPRELELETYLEGRDL